jgi:bacteriorhodopsin
MWLASAFYVLNQFKVQTSRGGRAFVTAHASLAMLLILPCVCYTVLWVIADGFRTIPFTSEAIVFTLVDSVARNGFVAYFALKAQVMDASRAFVLVEHEADER